jgi:PIN domain
MTRVVLDTNIYISAVMFGGLPGVVVDLAFGRAFRLLASPVLFDEVVEKLETKFGVMSKDAALPRAKLEGGKNLAALSQLRTFFGFFAPIFIVKACVFIGALPENGRVETKDLPFNNGLLAVCR